MEEEHPTLLILGVLLTLRYLVPLLQQQVKDTSLKGSFGVTRKELEVSFSAEQLVQVGVLVGSRTIQRGSHLEGKWQNPEIRLWFRSSIMAPGSMNSVLQSHQSEMGVISCRASVLHKAYRPLPGIQTLLTVSKTRARGMCSPVNFG